jgi:hypothetical protein
MAVFFIRSELLPIRAGIRRVAPERTPHVLEPLDIFKMQEDGSYVWKAAAETFEVATSKIEQLASIAPGDYMIFKTTGKKTVIHVLSQWMLETKPKYRGTEFWRRYWWTD